MDHDFVKQWDNFMFLDKSKEAKRVKELEEYKKSIPAPKQAKPKYVLIIVNVLWGEQL